MRAKLRFVLETLGTLLISVAYGLLFCLILIAVFTFFGVDFRPLFGLVDTQVQAFWPSAQSVVPLRMTVLALPFIAAGIVGVYLARENLPTVMTAFVIVPLVGLILALIQQRFASGSADLETMLLVFIVFGLYGLRLTYSHSFKS